MSARFFLHHLWRETRGSWRRFAFFLACLAVGVGAVVAVAGLGAEVHRIIRTEARQLLAADLALSGRQPPPGELDEFLRDHPEYERTSIRELVGMSASPPRQGRPGASQLVELKVIDGTYPFYGRLGLEPAGRLSDLLSPTRAVVAPDLLVRLGLAVGDSILIGGHRFEIAGTVDAEPDRMDGLFTLGPRVFLGAEGLDRTGLVQYGSRVSYRELLRLPQGLTPEEIQQVAESLEAALPVAGLYRIETYVDAQPALRRGLERVERFLGLVALLSLLVGGVGVAQTVRSWLASRIDAIATLRCIGVRPNEVVALYLGHTLLLGLLGSLAGVALGLGVQTVVPRLLADLLPDLLPGELERVWHTTAVARGLLLGIAVAALFSLPTLLATRRIPPARVLRRDAEPLPARRRVGVALVVVLATGIWAAAALQADSARLGAWFTGMLLVVTGLLALAAWLLARAARRWPRRRAAVWVRHGLGALGRPGAGTIGAIVALGLGVVVVLGISLVEMGLSEELETALPTDAPTAFLIDIQPHQYEGVRELLVDEGADRIDSVPVVSARLEAIDGRPLERLLEEAGDDRSRRWALTREQRLTYLEELPEGNEVVAGELWAEPHLDEVSLEEEYARDLGVGLGAELALDIQGVPADLTVTSLRSVDWETFGINFFVIVEPGVLDEAPHFRIASTRVPAGAETPLQDRLAASYPNVTMIKIRQVLTTIRNALARLGVGVRFLGGFTMVAGLVILAGAISAGTVRRGREVALLKTLGVTRWGVVAIFAVEYALIGVVAGTIGTAGSVALSWAVLTRVMEVSWSLRPAWVVAAPLACALLAVATGLAVSSGPLRHRPSDVLRNE